MENEAIKIYGMILDNASNINKEIQLQIYKILDLDGKKLSINENEDIRIKEEIKTSIEKFSFNLQELDFLTQIKEIIEDEMKKVQTTRNFELMQEKLLERLKGLRNIDVSLEDDFKNLSSRIANPVLSRDMFYNYFISKNEKINDMIKLYNQTIINSLINLTPHFIKGIQENNKSNASSIQPQSENNSNLIEETKSINNSSQIIESSVIKQATIDLLQKQIDDIDNQWHKFLELDDVVEKNEQINSISKIAKYYRKIKKIMGDIQSNNIIIEGMTQNQATTFYDKLLSEQIPEYNDIMQIIEKYKKGVISVETKINNFVLEIHSKISLTTNINELLNYKKEIETALKKYKYLKNEQLDLELLNVINKIVSLTGPDINRHKNPDSPNPSNIGAEIGETNESMIQLVESGSYFSVLQGITDNNINKYKNFINNGFRVIFDKWKIVAEQAKTNEQRMESYKQLKEIYNQFKSYLQSEKDTLNMLETMISSMDEYFIMQQRKQQNQIIEDGVRYNTQNAEHSNSTMRR